MLYIPPPKLHSYWFRRYLVLTPTLGQGITSTTPWKGFGHAQERFPRVIPSQIGPWMIRGSQGVVTSEKPEFVPSLGARPWFLSMCEAIVPCETPHKVHAKPLNLSFLPRAVDPIEERTDRLTFTKTRFES